MTIQKAFRVDLLIENKLIIVIKAVLEINDYLFFPAFKLFKINRNEVGNDFKFSFNVIQKWSKKSSKKIINNC